MHKYTVQKFQSSGKIGSPYGSQTTDPYKSGIDFQNSSIFKTNSNPTFDIGFQNFLKKNGLNSQNLGSTENFFRGQYAQNSITTNNNLKIGQAPQIPQMGFGGIESSTKKLGDKYKNEIGLAPEVGEAAIKFLGGKEADNISGGEQLFSKGTDLAFKTAIKSGNPIAIGVTGALKGVDWLNRFAGDTAKTQQTKDLSLTGYNTQISPGAGKKNTLIGSWFGHKTSNANKLTNYADQQNILAGVASGVGRQDLLMAANSTKDTTSRNYFGLRGGQTTSILSAKNGANINPAKLRDIVDKVVKFKKGGIIKKELLNVIPEGALHARKNNYGGTLGEQVTNKGIPVITQDEDKITQHAEIEREEIIFHKQITDQLEDFAKKYQETEDSNEQNSIAIECGKFLTSEILENTQDNTGLLETIQ